MNTLVFNIQTIPDIDGARRLYDLHGLSEDDVAKAIFHKRRQQANTETLRHHVHKIVAISAVLLNGDSFKVWSLGDSSSTESDLLQRFFDGLERFSPTLVTWNGSGFDLPVIHYRSLLYPVNAERYWNAGDRENTVFSKFQHNHTDLMDVLSGHQIQATIDLQEIATLCGFPGNLGLQSHEIWKTWLAGGMGTIRNTSETRVLNIYLIYLNWQRNCGHIDQQQYYQQCQQVRDQLQNSSKAHLIEFEKSWIDL